MGLRGIRWQRTAQNGSTSFCSKLSQCLIEEKMKVNLKKQLLVKKQLLRIRLAKSLPRFGSGKGFLKSKDTL